MVSKMILRGLNFLSNLPIKRPLNTFVYFYNNNVCNVMYAYYNYLIMGRCQVVLCVVRKIIIQPYQDRKKQVKLNKSLLY